VELLFLTGGVGWGWYGFSVDEPKSDNPSKNERVDIVKVSTPIFMAGGGICLCIDDGKGDGLVGIGLVLEGLYNIVPLKGRTASYMSINGGLKLYFRMTEEKKHVKQMI
jgi:hypothetical protein